MFYQVHWRKTYHAEGEVLIEAGSKREAKEVVALSIVRLKGNKIHNPTQDYIKVGKTIKDLPDDVAVAFTGED